MTWIYPETDPHFVGYSGDEEAIERWHRISALTDDDRTWLREHGWDAMKWLRWDRPDLRFGFVYNFAGTA